MSIVDGPDNRLSVEWIDHDDDSAGPRPSSRRERTIWGRRSRVRWIALILVAALIGAGVWYVVRPDRPPAVTFAGATVDNSAALIAQADTELAAFVRSNHGSVSAHTRCYLAKVGGRVSTDVSRDVYCGPVLFYRGAAPALYLSFGLSTSAPVSSGHVRLTLQASPNPRTPVRIPTGAVLERPDRKEPPVGSDGLVAPGPPPAASDVAVIVNQADVAKIPSAPATAVIGSRNISVALLASGYVSSYGRFAATRSAPAGHRLLAVKLLFTDGEYNSLTLDEEEVRVQLVVDGGKPRQLGLVFAPGTDAVGEIGLTRFVVVAVPTDVHSVDLVVRDGSLTQSLSLLTGTPAPGNIAIFQRSAADRQVDFGPSVTAVMTSDDSAVPSPVNLTIELSSAHLGYFLPYGDPGNASGPDRAFLTIALCSSSPVVGAVGQLDGVCVGFNPADISLIPAGGGDPILPAYEFTDPGVFDVPASFTSGTLIVDGTVVGGDGSILRIAKPVQLAITFP